MPNFHKVLLIDDVFHVYIEKGIQLVGRNSRTAINWNPLSSQRLMQSEHEWGWISISYLTNSFQIDFVTTVSGILSVLFISLWPYGLLIRMIVMQFFFTQNGVKHALIERTDHILFIGFIGTSLKITCTLNSEKRDYWIRKALLNVNWDFGKSFNLKDNVVESIKFPELTRTI